MDYPELPLARGAVSLYLGCGHSTGNVERLLKLVAIREHIRSPAFIQDVMFCSQAPKVKDVTYASPAQIGTPRCNAPKGPYLPRIMKAYQHIFKGRAWSKDPKIRSLQRIEREEPEATKR